MKGLYLESIGQPPRLRAGGVIVRMRAVPVLSYTKEVLSGKLGYLFPTPLIPGNAGVGVVESVADDVFGLVPGQWVAVDPRITAHDNAKPDQADWVLIGLTASTPASQRLQALWAQGSYAEKALLPAECLTPLDALAAFPPARLALLSRIAIPYGGLVRGDLRPGQTVAINGATGVFGSSAVVAALALGAARVLAVGRDAHALGALAALDPARVVPCPLGSGPVVEQAARLRAAAGPWGVDLYFDMLGRADDPDPILAGLGALRHRGTAVLMGGVRIPIPLSYAEIMHRELTIIGNFMYPRGALRELVALAAARVLNLDAFATATFPLEDFAAAFDRAETAKGLESVALLM